MLRYKHKQGFTLIEVVITASVFLVVILGVAGSFSSAVRTSIQNVDKVKASFLGEEGLEAVRLLRDSSWTGNIADKTSGAPFYLHFDGVSWTATSTNVLIDEVFERSIVFSDVYRDSSQNIVSTGGTLDPDIKKVTTLISWSYKGATTTRSLSTYLSNIF